MKNIVGVQFKEGEKIYFFNPNGIDVKKSDKVVVGTDEGYEYGEIVAIREVENEKVVNSLQKVVRIATERDHQHYKNCKKLEKEAFKVCIQKIKEHKLDMKLTEAEYKFDNSKILFYFIAEERIDFRELVRDLAAIYKTRIELRQIGVRDQVKKIGGNRSMPEENYVVAHF